MMPIHRLNGLHNPCRLRGALRFTTGTQVAHKWAEWLHKPCRVGVPNTSGESLHCACIARYF